MAGELRAAVAAMDVDVWAPRTFASYAFRTRRVEGGLVEVEFWSSNAWAPLDTIGLSGWSTNFGQVRSQLRPKDRVSAAELADIDWKDVG